MPNFFSFPLVSLIPALNSPDRKDGLLQISLGIVHLSVSLLFLLLHVSPFGRTKQLFHNLISDY